MTDSTKKLILVAEIGIILYLWLNRPKCQLNKVVTSLPPTNSQLYTTDPLVVWLPPMPTDDFPQEEPYEIEDPLEIIVHAPMPQCIPCENNPDRCYDPEIEYLLDPCAKEPSGGFSNSGIMEVGKKVFGQW